MINNKIAIMRIADEEKEYKKIYFFEFICYFF